MDESWCRYFPFGNFVGRAFGLQSSVSDAIGSYLPQLLILSSLAGLGGIALALVNGRLYQLGWRLPVSGLPIWQLLDGLVELVDSVPRLAVVLLCLPLMPSVEEQYLLAIMVLLGLLFIPVVYKSGFERIQYFLDHDFVIAGEMLGKTYFELATRQILWRNSRPHLVRAILRSAAVAILVETALSSLDVVLHRYSSLATLVQTKWHQVQNPAEILLPLVLLYGLIALFSLLVDLLEQENNNG
jgi:ABC-type dipeptide/oligopeptide/nickel transport system permease subunit